MSSSITASQLYSHLSCPHRVAKDTFGDPRDRDQVSPFVQMLWERGTLFERDVIGVLGQPITDLSALTGPEKEAATRAAIQRGDTLIYSGRLSVDELLGEPDLLRREGGGYAAIDIKSGSAQEGGGEGDDPNGTLDHQHGKLKKHYGVQIALYTDILHRIGHAAGRYGYIWDIHGEEVRYDLDSPLGPRSPSMWEIYLETWQAVSETLAKTVHTRPAAASVCKLCVWRSSCFREMKACQDLTLLPELGRARRDALSDQFPTLNSLAQGSVDRFIHGHKTDFPGIGAGTLRKFKARAELAVALKPVPFLTHSVNWPTATTELFFDIETDPMRGLCYLHGFVIREAGNSQTERFEGIFAQDISPDAEKRAYAAAIAVFRRYPSAVVIHYSKYERTEYRRLQKKYPDVAGVAEIEALFQSPRAFDLYSDVIRPYSEWPTLDFSIKSIATACGFAWRDADPSGASSIEWFDQWVKTRNPAYYRRLLDYNEDDCRAMRVVLDTAKTLKANTG